MYSLEWNSLSIREIFSLRVLYPLWDALARRAARRSELLAASSPPTFGVGAKLLVVVFLPLCTFQGSLAEAFAINSKIVEGTIKSFIVAEVSKIMLVVVRIQSRTSRPFEIIRIGEEEAYGVRRRMRSVIKNWLYCGDARALSSQYHVDAFIRDGDVRHSPF